jgi:hypothetical protein
VKFNDYVDFSSSTFNSSANFNSVNFDSSSRFFGVTFNSSAYFYQAIFNNSADFFGVTFNSLSDFIWVTFNSSADFSYSSFNSLTDFSFSSFNSSSDFTGVKFNSSACFISVSFASPSDFQILLPDTSENIITDGKTCEFFREYYKNEARYEDADNIYYNYRRNYQSEKSLLSPSKWMDILSWITCGYGLKPFNSFLFGTMIIFLFSVIYINPVCLSINRSTRIPILLSLNISLNKSSNKIIPFKLSLKNPGIVKNDDQSQIASLLDIFYYSVCRFTFMSYENWYPKDNFRIFTIIEGILGWATLGIFMATLTAVMIRI